MTEQRSLAEIIEDRALERVPMADRKGLWDLVSINAGLTTTLVPLLIGGIVTAMVGFWNGILASLPALFATAVFIYLIGIISCREGLSRDLLTRAYGLGTRGSALGSAIMAFMLIGMLSLEGVMLGDGLMFAFNIPDTITSKLIMYIIFGILWVLFSLFGAKVVAIIAKIAVPLYAIFLVIVLVKVLAGASFSATVAKTVIPGAIAPAQWAAAINATLGVAGLMALFDADYTRFAKKDSHLIPFALTGAIIQDFIMIALGGLLAFAGYDKALAYYHSIGLTGPAAVQAAMSNPGVVFVLYGGIAGGILIFLSQSKAQAMNSYDGSLSFSNFLATLFNWKPGRMWSVIIVNIIAIVFIFGGILNLVSQFLTIGSDISGVWATIIATDYLFVRGVLKVAPKQIDNLENIASINWVGFLTFVVASFVSMWLFYANIVLVPFVIGVPLAFLLYVCGTLGTKGCYIIEKAGAKHGISIG